MFRKRSLQLQLVKGSKWKCLVSKVSIKYNESCLERTKRGMHTQKHEKECYIKAKAEMGEELTQDKEC